MNEPVTQTILEEALTRERKITKRDLKDELQVFKVEFKEELKMELNQELATFFGQIIHYLDEKFETFQKSIQASVDGHGVQIDKITKRVDDDDLERVAIGHQVDRHQGWIGQLAENTKTNLQPKIS